MFQVDQSTGKGSTKNRDEMVFSFLVFGLIYRHTASNPITTEMHTSGVQ